MTVNEARALLVHLTRQAMRIGAEQLAGKGVSVRVGTDLTGEMHVDVAGRDFCVLVVNCGSTRDGDVVEWEKRR